MKELLALLKAKIEGEVKKDPIPTGRVRELTEIYSRIELLDAETVDAVVSEDMLGSDMGLRPAVLRNRQTDIMGDELLAVFKTFKYLTAPQEVSATMDLRRHFVEIGDKDMVTRIDGSLKKKMEDMLGE